MDFLIKSVSCVIPGFTDHEEGELISTEEILSNMEKPASDDQSIKAFDPSFIRKKIGIESVSMSKSTAKFVRKYWGMSARPSKSEIFSASQSTPNESLYRMMGQAISKCLKDVEDNSKFDRASFLAHIHISAFFSPWVEHEFLKLRRSMGIGLHRPLQTLMLQQGCSGLFAAIELAKSILTEKQRTGHILITGDNNMMIHAHQRCEKIARTDNVNQWLWPAIFGEGVGAIIVGSGETDRNRAIEHRWGLAVDSLKQEIVETDWRVAHQWRTDEKSTSVFIKAKEVSDTYLKYIKKFSIDAIEKCGGLDSMFRLCLHESNPRLISILKRDLKISSDEMIPTISSKVGTLACVSAFSLLDLSIRALGRHMKDPAINTKKSKMALALIGETCGNIVAGNICLSAKQF